MKQLRIPLMILIVFTILCGAVYPLIITGAGYIFFKEKTEGSLIRKNGSVSGSDLIGQYFIKPEYFHGRPSAVHYDSSSSGGSNLGATNRKLKDIAEIQRALIIKENGLNENDAIPADQIFSSGSGLDPHISVEAAMLQSKRIAFARKIDNPEIIELIKRNTERQLPFYGKYYVNVFKINSALDEMRTAK